MSLNFHLLAGSDSQTERKDVGNLGLSDNSSAAFRSATACLSLRYLIRLLFCTGSIPSSWAMGRASVAVAELHAQ